jgi:hypothetical protein
MFQKKSLFLVRSLNDGDAIFHEIFNESSIVTNMS